MLLVDLFPGGPGAEVSRGKEPISHFLLSTLYYLFSCYTKVCISEVLTAKFPLIEGSLEVQLPTIWKDEKQSREAESEESRVSRKKRKVWKVANHYVFPMICGLGGSKSRLAKGEGRSHVARGEMKNCTPLWREAHLQVKMHKRHHPRTNFGSSDVEHAAVARGTFTSKNVNTPPTDHFWKFRCGFGPLLEVGMWKNCRPLWHEELSQNDKTHHARTTFASWHVQKWHAAVAQSAFVSQNV